MSISLQSIRTVTADQPPRILIYGPPGIGKTTLASEFPNPVFLQVEDGTPGGIALQSFGKLETFSQVEAAMGALLAEKHDFKTVVLDSVTEMQRLVFVETCRRGDDKGVPKNDIGDFAYGNGYTKSVNLWRYLMDGFDRLRGAGMTVIFTGHSKVDRFDDPETASYDRYSIDLHKSGVGAIEREMDAIFLMKQPVNVVEDQAGFNSRTRAQDSGGVVEINTVGRPAFTAKNRYNIPARLRYDLGKGYEALAPYFPALSAPAPITEKEAEKEAA